MAYVLAEVGELTHYAAADGSVFGFADEQYGFYACKHAVDIGYVAFVFEVYSVAYAANDELCSDGLSKIGCQSFIAHYVDAWLCLIERCDVFYAFLQGEHGMFACIDADSDI